MRKPFVRGARIAGRWYVCAWGMVGEGASLGAAIADLETRGREWARRWFQ